VYLYNPQYIAKTTDEEIRADISAKMEFGKSVNDKYGNGTVFAWVYINKTPTEVHASVELFKSDSGEFGFKGGGKGYSMTFQLHNNELLLVRKVFVEY
jgi:hypothetical protein